MASASSTIAASIDPAEAATRVRSDEEHASALIEHYQGLIAAKRLAA